MTLYLSSVIIILLTTDDLPFTPVTRTTALLSLESAILSTLYSHVYFFRFASLPELRIAHRVVSSKSPLLRRGTCKFVEPLLRLLINCLTLANPRRHSGPYASSSHCRRSIFCGP